MGSMIHGHKRVALHKDTFNTSNFFELCMAFTPMVAKHDWRVALHCQVEQNSSSKCLVFI